MASLFISLTGPSLTPVHLPAGTYFGGLPVHQLGQRGVPTEHPELIAGPWEAASVSAIDGISFEIVASSSGPSGREQFDWQTMNIRVYHREGGKETWGYFGTKDKASPQSYSMPDDHSFTLFDGERLRIHFVDGTELKSSRNRDKWKPTIEKHITYWKQLCRAAISL